MGQGESAERARSGEAVAPDSRPAASPNQIIQAPRLLASDPQVNGVPKVELTTGLPPLPVVERARRAPVIRQPMPAPDGRTSPAAGAASPYDRIAALSAVTATQGPGEAEPRDEPTFSSGWVDEARGYAVRHMRELGLILAMLATAILLFWRLGERSRHEAQELFLTAETQAGLDPEPDLVEIADLPAAPAIRRAEDRRDQPIIRPERAHETLRDAVQAMKARSLR